jgi:NAD(P)H-quinone oxidoreductase subunit 2
VNSLQDYYNAVQLLQPEIWMTCAIVVATLWNLFFPRAQRWTAVWSLVGLFLAGASLLPQMQLATTPILGGLFTVDKLTVGFGLLAVAVGFIVCLMTMGYEKQLGTNRGEFYALLLIAVMAVMLLAGTTDLIMLFVALETLSICCVLLTGLFKRDRLSNEASLKYLLSTAAVTATLMYGLSFIYGMTQSTNYGEIHIRLASMIQQPSLLMVFIMVLLISAVGFKLSVVPFHMWTPDVYEGAPTPVTAFLSIGSKAGGFVVAVRLLSFMFAGAVADWSVILGILAILSMVVGNFIAIAQSSLKRMLAYSSIAQVGYILIGIIANTSDGLSAMMFYLIVYGLMNLGAFAGAILFSNETGSDNIDDFAGLFRKRPWLALGLSICLLNLAGLPIPPAGFLAKAFVFWSGIQMGSALGWALVVAALLTSVPAVYYYTRPIIKMIVREPSEAVKALGEDRPRMSDPQGAPILALAVCVAGIIFGSVALGPFMNLARESVSPISAPPQIGSLQQPPVQ